MKSVKNQYIALKEGKITEAQFMRNIRMSLPEYISNVTLFKQAERILINKGIINEIGPNIDKANFGTYKVGDEFTVNNMDNLPQSYEDLQIGDKLKIVKTWSNLTGKELYGTDKKPDRGLYADDIKDLTKSNSNESLNEDKDKKSNKQKLIDAGYSESDAEDFADEFKQGGFKLPKKVKDILKEAKDTGYYNQDGKEQIAKFDELDTMNAQEIMAGYVMEKIDNPEIDKKEACKLVIKNLNKDPYYYTNYKLTGVRCQLPQESTPTKRKFGFDQQEEISKNGDNFVDVKNKMQLVKEGHGDNYSIYLSTEPIYTSLPINRLKSVLYSLKNELGEDLNDYIVMKNNTNKTKPANELGWDLSNISPFDNLESLKNKISNIANLKEVKVEDIKALLSDETINKSDIGGDKGNISIIYNNYKKLPFNDLDKLKNSFNVDEDRLSDEGETEIYQYYISDKLNENISDDKDKSQKYKLKEMVRKIMKEMIDDDDNMTDMTGQQKIQQYIKDGGKGDLDLYNTKITKLPQGLKVGGNLYLQSTSITSLPQGLTVGGSLYLQSTPITSLPQGLTVGGNLYLSNTPITSLPQGLNVGGDLYLKNTPLSKNNTIEQIKTMAPGVKGDILM